MSSKDTNPKDAIGIKKPPLSTVPLPVLFEVGAAMLEGACKYRRHNYRVAGVRGSVYFDAAWRHLAAWWEGEDIDLDSGLHHVSKAIATLVVLRDAMMNDKFVDDRPPSSEAGWMAKIQERIDDVLARYPDPKPPYVKAGEEAPETIEEHLKKAGFEFHGPRTTVPWANLGAHERLMLERQAKEAKEDKP